jgi:hypothetical protein
MMRRTLTSIIALGFAVTSTTAVLADENDDVEDIAAGFTEDQERFTDAGFEGARVMQNVEVAKVTKDDETFFVVHGLGNGMGMDQTGIQQQPGTQTGQVGGMQDDLAADDPLAQDTAPGAQAGQPGDMQDDLAADDPLAQDTAPGAQAGQPGGMQDDLAADDPLAQDTAPGAQVGQQDDLAADRPVGMGEHRSLEELLEEAGIEDYEILDDALVASTRLGDIDGQEVYVIYGLDDVEGDS